MADNQSQAQQGPDASWAGPGAGAAPSNTIPMPEVQHNHEEADNGPSLAFPVPQVDREEGQHPGALRPGGRDTSAAPMPQPYGTPSGPPPGHRLNNSNSVNDYVPPPGPPPPTFSQPQPQPARAFSPPPPSQNEDQFRPPSQPPPSHQTPGSHDSRAFSPPPSYDQQNGRGYPPVPGGPTNVQPQAQGRMRMQGPANRDYYNNHPNADGPYLGPAPGGYGHGQFAPPGHGHGYDNQTGYVPGPYGRQSMDSDRYSRESGRRERISGPNVMDACGIGACLSFLCCCCLLY